MDRRELTTPDGNIVYCVSRVAGPGRPWLVFLPGLTADHRLFERQVEHFEGSANVLVWDAPSHGESRPFALTWTMDDLARWLHDILEREGAVRPILVGQSMGGYTAQAFMELFPGGAAGFVSIDSCPLQRSYYTWWELAALRHTKLMYLSFPWKTLVALGANGTASSERGRALMREMMLGYRKREYCELAAHGYQVLADAVAADRPYRIDCPVMLVCGEEDRAGSAKRYNRAWAQRTGLPIHWIAGAGHNSNTDDPGTVNELLEKFVGSLSVAWHSGKGSDLMSQRNGCSGDDVEPGPSSRFAM